ncbi:MAG: TIGR02186 family protein [Acidobacteriota bacterium]
MKRTVLFLLSLLLCLPAAARAAGIDFTAQPAAIEIGTLYKGTAIQVEGRVPEGTQVVLRFTGAPEDLRMKQKGKAMGLLWMNMNTLHFGNVPKVCLIDSSAPLKDLGLDGAKLGLMGLAENVSVEPATADRATLLPELVTLKEQEGLFRQSSGGVKLGEKRDGLQAFSATLAVPSRLSPGSYSVEVFALRDGTIQAQAAKAVDARLVGAPALLADLAFNHGAWYGILASIIAILGGLAIGLVFQSMGAH